MRMSWKEAVRKTGSKEDRQSGRQEVKKTGMVRKMYLGLAWGGGFSWTGGNRPRTQQFPG